MSGGHLIFRFLTIFGGLWVAALNAQAIIDRTVEQTFALTDAAGATLEVDTFFGGIKVVTTQKPEIHVLVREAIEAKTEAEADRELRDLDLQITAKANTVSAKAVYRRNVRWTWEKWPPIGLSFEIEIPAHCNVRLISKEGALTIPAVQGNIEARAQLGDVFIGVVNGAVTVVAGQGNVTVAACSQKLSVEAHAGNILIGRTESAAEIIGIGGTVEVQSSHGNLRVKGDGADLKVGFVYPLHGDAEVRSSGGDVEATFESTLTANVEAHSSTFSQVRVRDLDLKLTTGKPGETHVAGRLNGGGPLLQIRSSGGSVRLRGVPAIGP